ncbi:MAG TPA: helix-turn-helix domain-containing protein [Fimbriimonadaceae bacterium]|nr:helix-turn-helix domain-containing protein [Fimbriimonadaceae bacterium]HRJ95777.1 helix-turn-helix domain-containing protein [Fimbriimonadaceae bacterium]
MRIQTRHLRLASVHRIVQHALLAEDRTMRMGDLAAVAGLSRFHLTRVFHAVTGEGVAEFVRRINLERAALRLRDTTAPIIDLACDAGYSNGEAFARAFRGCYGVSPSEFRRRQDLDWRLGDSRNVHWTPSPNGFRPLALEGAPVPVELVFRPSERLAAFRRVGSYSDLACEWRRFQLLRLGDDSAGERRYFAVFHDKYDKQRDDLRYDLCITWPGDRPLPIGARPLVLPSGSYLATCEPVSRKAYGQTWALLNREWLPQNGQRPVNVPCLDEYEGSPDPWESMRARLLIGLEMDLGAP